MERGIIYSILRKWYHYARRSYCDIKIINHVLLKTIHTLRCNPKRTKFFDKNICKRRVILIANGPSAGGLDFERLADSNLEYAVVNYFPLQEKSFFLLKPRFLCIMDSKVFDLSNEKYPYIKQNKKMVEILNKVDWELFVITNHGLMLPTKNDYIRYEWLSTQQIDYDKRIGIITKVLKSNLAIGGNENTPVSLLWYLMMNGFSRISIIGLDLDFITQYKVDENNHLLLCDNHFYGQATLDYVEAGIYKVGEFYKKLYSDAECFKQYMLASKYAIDNNIEIVNYNKRSFVDVFEKADIERIYD